MKKIGVVIVSYGNDEDILNLLKGIQPQIKPGDKIVVVDNKKPYDFADYLVHNTQDILVLTHNNGGFGAGCNFGANAIADTVDILLFLNPDTYMKQADYLDNMREGYGTYDIWQSLLLLPEDRINSCGNNVHITGLTWSDGFNKPRPAEPHNKSISNVSGACLAIDVKWWKRISGFTEEYFMYFEDVDISTKILIAGGRLGILEGAEIYHHYDFEKGDHKWRYIERNRQMFMLINWPARLLMATFIPNVLFDFVVFLQYVAKKRGLVKVRSDIDFIQNIPVCIKLRRERQSLWAITPKEYFRHIGYAMDTDLLGKITDNKVVYTVMKGYYNIVKLLFV